MSGQETRQQRQQRRIAALPPAINAAAAAVGYARKHNIIAAASALNEAAGHYGKMTKDEDDDRYAKDKAAAQGALIAIVAAGEAFVDMAKSKAEGAALELGGSLSLGDLLARKQGKAD